MKKNSLKKSREIVWARKYWKEKTDYEITSRVGVCGRRVD